MTKIIITSTKGGTVEILLADKPVQEIVEILNSNGAKMA